MTRFASTRTFFCGLLLCAGVAQAGVEPKSGLEYPDAITVATPSGTATLVATGAGLREKSIMKVDVYTLVSYVDSSAVLGDEPTAAILGLDVPKQLRMQMRRDVGRDKLTGSLVESMRNNVQDMATIEAELEAFLGFFARDAHDGDRIVFDYVPGVGLTTWLNDEQLGKIDSTAFAGALWSVWFGEHPADGHLSRALVSRAGGTD